MIDGRRSRWGQPHLWTRRDWLLRAGLTGTGLLGAGALAAWGQHWWADRAVAVPPMPDAPPVYGNGLGPMQVLRLFDYGRVKRENGRTIREFQITANATNLPLNSVVSFPSWNYNGRVPGPTLRAKAGDRLRIAFLNRSGHAHTIHFHGIHPAAMDGIRPIRNEAATIYEFDAEPYGLHLYHCHVGPVARHIEKGLVGMLIIDPPEGRPPADEMAIVMHGYDLNDDGRNELYAFNGIPDFYKHYPIPIYQNQLVRIYLLNAVEYDPALTFHLHANFFQVYPTGMTRQPTMTTDVLTMGTIERHILEFRYQHPGSYMFHPHQDAIAEAGCMGLFQVLPMRST